MMLIITRQNGSLLIELLLVVSIVSGVMLSFAHYSLQLITAFENNRQKMQIAHAIQLLSARLSYQKNSLLIFREWEKEMHSEWPESHFLLEYYPVPVLRFQLTSQDVLAQVFL